MRYPLMLLLGIVIISSAFGSQSSEAAFPGENGKIAFVSSRTVKFDVFVMNADGDGQTNLTNNAATDSDPAWSPDGTKIAFNSSRDGNFDVFIMNADGSGPIRLTND